MTKRSYISGRLKSTLTTGVFLLILFLYFLNHLNNKKPDLNASEKQIKFDREKWFEKKENEYPFRKLMTEDILSNKGLRDLSVKEIETKFGLPSYMRENNNFYYYRVHERKIGMLTIHTKTIVIKFDDNKKVKWIKIHE